jgi:uncharacterized protein YbjT (DUF2867 family)
MGQTGSKRILLTGATGYVGGHVLARLEALNLPVRCLTRRAGMPGRRVGPRTEVVTGDVLEPESMARAMEGISAAYYLVHSMSSAPNFEELDRRGALNFAAAARLASVGKIVYLGGLGSGEELSRHLASRHEVGSILRASGIPTIELRASIVIGAGSASFETIRTLVEHLPAIPAPRAIETAAQPIAIDDVVEYLVAAIMSPPSESNIVEIGGADRVTYAELMHEYARQRHLRRRVIPTKLITPRVSSMALALVPLYGQIAASMATSLCNATVVEESSARDVFPVKPSGLAAAVDRALRNEDRQFAEMEWSSAAALSPGVRWGGTPVGRRRVSSRAMAVRGGPDEAFARIQRIGGTTGWYAVDWFWQLRGLLDRLRGGEGFRRGRRDPHDLRVGDRVDCWRVERLEQGRRLLLAAEMKLPGRLWLQFEVNPRAGRTEIRQTTIFDPGGLVGLLYWYLLYPVHHSIFGAILRGLVRAGGR